MTTRETPTGENEGGRAGTVIGLTTIWREGDCVDRGTPIAIAKHIIRRAEENIAKSPLTALLTVFTIGIALFLLGVFVLFIENVRGIIKTQSAEVTMSLFIREGVGESDVQNLVKELQTSPGVQSVTYRDKAKALEAFRRSLGPDAAVLDGLEQANPLPASVEAVMTVDSEISERLESLVNKYNVDKRVEYVRYSRGLVEQLHRVVRVIELGGWFGVLLLLLLAGFIIANTIKLALYSHRNEIEIMQLVGATRWSIQAPYVLEGFFQGIIGAALSVILVFVTYLFLQDVLVKADLLRFIFPAFHFLSGEAVALLAAAGMIVGTAGSFLAVRRFLRDE